MSEVSPNTASATPTVTNATPGSATATRLYRYPGVRPFNKTEKNIFFGREQEAKKLYNLIMLEKMVVLFGKSGRGKSSLINAAIMPMITEDNTAKRYNYTPIEVRFGIVAGDDSSPVQKVVAKLKELIHVPDTAAQVLNKQPYQHQLWYHFKKVQLHQPIKFLLIFDQFEEFFSYPDKMQEEFRWELAELLYTQVPEAVRENIDAYTHDEYTQLSALLDIKVLFAIRSDRLSGMHSMKDALPNILQNRFEINSLTIEQARNAIIMPAAINDPAFATHPFTYDEESLNTIITELSTMRSYQSENIETFHLQIICQGCEAKIEEKMAQGIKDTEINKNDLPKFDDLYGDYYKRQIDKLPEELRAKAQSLLENNLIYGGPTSGGYKRLSVDKNILLDQLKEMGAPIKILELLEDSFLIRREPNTVGGYSYEISHDTILEPIINIKNERLRKEELEKNWERIKEVAKKESEKKMRTRSLMVLSAILVGLLVYFNWDTIYFSYKTAFNKDNYPVVRQKEKLNNVVKMLSEEVITSARLINKEPNLNSWEASQLIAALYGGPNDINNITPAIRQQFNNLISRTMVTDCCCWREKVNQNDYRITSWILSSSAILGNVDHNKICGFNFLMDNQFKNGAWSMIQVEKPLSDYSSTYATCHALRALYNAKSIVPDSVQLKIDSCISKGAAWLLSSMEDTARAIWNDYEQDENYESLVSKSLSGLAIHTLNLINKAQPQLNHKWLRNLKKGDAAVDINLKENSDKDYKTQSGEIIFRDDTRHLVVPWQVVGTIDAYKDGDFYERYKANIWLDNVVDNLDMDDLRKRPRFVKAEIMMALRYLQDQHYVFK